MRVNKGDVLWSRADSERDCDLEGKIMTALKASKSKNAREDGFAAFNPTLLKETTRWPSTTEVAFPFLVNDRERRSPDGATQGSSAKSAAT